MKCCNGRWANWAKANWANSLLHCVFDTNKAFLTLVPARQSALRDFFLPFRHFGRWQIKNRRKIWRFAIYSLTLPLNNKMRTEGLGGSEPKRPLTFENLNKYGCT